jgi:hypothetical protein
VDVLMMEEGEAAGSAEEEGGRARPGSPKTQVTGALTGSSAVNRRFSRHQMQG